MREIVILSGKGGVGKSSVAASLATLFARKSSVLLADTDVDAPNLHLIMNARLTSSQEVAASSKASIDPAQCIRCMKCLEVCRFSALIGVERPIVVPYSCEGCGACTIVCPQDAIAIREVINGQVNVFTAGKILMVAGELHIGETSSGRIVDIVKKRARKEATAAGIEVIFTDGPPGIGCPVIASVKGADYVVLISEPTPAALHDLKRIVGVVRHFGIPLGIVLNRADIHPESNRAAKNLAESHGIDLLGEIPYDRSVPMALANAQPVVAAYPSAPASLAITGLLAALEEKSGMLP